MREGRIPHSALTVAGWRVSSIIDCLSVDWARPALVGSLAREVRG